MLSSSPSMQMLLMERFWRSSKFASSKSVSSPLLAQDFTLASSSLASRSCSLYFRSSPMISPKSFKFIYFNWFSISLLLLPLSYVKLSINMLEMLVSPWLTAGAPTPPSNTDRSMSSNMEFSASSYFPAWERSISEVGTLNLPLTSLLGTFWFKLL